MLSFSRIVVCTTLRTLFLLCCGSGFVTCACQSVTFARVTCTSAGAARVVDSTGKTVLAPGERGQTGCDDATIATDGKAAGWSVLSQDPGSPTSLRTSVVVWSGHYKHVFSADQIVWHWRFVKGGRRVALLSGPVHGNAALAELFDCRSGRRLARWRGDGDPPAWAAKWKQDFAVY